MPPRNVRWAKTNTSTSFREEEGSLSDGNEELSEDVEVTCSLKREHRLMKYRIMSSV
jgi:hypothetical protein